MALLTENDHGLGINRDVEESEVHNLEQSINDAATKANALGVSPERFLELCKAAQDAESLAKEVLRVIRKETLHKNIEEFIAVWLDAEIERRKGELVAEQSPLSTVEDALGDPELNTLLKLREQVAA